LLCSECHFYLFEQMQFCTGFVVMLLTLELCLSGLAMVFWGLSWRVVLKDARFVIHVFLFEVLILWCCFVWWFACLIWAGDCEWEIESPEGKIHEVQGWLYDFFWATCQGLYWLCSQTRSPQTGYFISIFNRFLIKFIFFVVDSLKYFVMILFFFLGVSLGCSWH